ncbi:MAG: KpsF/GutQ family sugar-phosphate isomerase [Bacteroidales bacterium]|nr:KpsF/GutQ family sugar-phosphate isomerase [Bacteroidales bacterium]MBP5418793.1 KpsF/GutQ family sugar-phosphate isomerase [Bacteroidales bacterium]
MIPNLTDDFNKAVELIANSKGRCIVTGVGKSGHIGEKIAATLASTGTPSFFVNPLDAFHGDLGMFTSDDVVIAISYSGTTDELLRFVPLLMERDIPIIAMTGNPNSLLAEYSTAHLNISVKREAEPLNLAPTSSTTATLVMGDAIAIALIHIRNFKASDFAKFHPGGNLGKMLLSKVKNYMVSTNLPIVKPSSFVSDTIIEISKTKQGIAVVAVDGEILGVVTDGDVRRAMQNKRDEFFSLTVDSIMSRNPKTINENAKLTEASALMRQNNIHTLVVTDDNGQLAGLIDSFSCM